MNAQRLADLLNETRALDPHAVETLCDHRVVTNRAVADHPRVVVRSDAEALYPFSLSIIGLLNGLFEEGEMVLCRVYDDDGVFLQYATTEDFRAAGK